ncbi:conserved phage C-terminal domain-containing protein [Neobacillus massiliamazoniensis]|uniref:DnaD domain-containing protein n=1 Tax=Neobacillus massiliamazoniensis TaxID=1499688 RepID=A0A0U1NQM7_9BACI|nr:conserved phage C-terminal domain-containing protein [Neobacillus massiliamazoniensis]CRK80339.1 DnaD domain-containing protein [Neobacillus massiliamazoniensis]
MAKFRYVHTEFWQDAKVLEEMTPEDKYFYLYLLTNPNTTQIGVYQITKKQMAFDLGYSSESINSLLDRFINNHKIVKYNAETRELAILNWGKYNLNNTGKPVLDCIKKELTDVKDKTLLWEVMNQISNETVLNEFSQAVYDTYHDSSTTRGEKEKEKEEEKEEEKIYIPFSEIVSYLNEKANTNYKYSSKKTKDLIKARWNDGFIFDDFKTVIDKKVSEWLRDKEMCKYLRPETLFGNKFEGYLNQKSYGKRSLFDQGEESKKRQSSIKPLTQYELEEMKRLEEELPF